MYAVIASGGKQVTVAPGDTVKIEKLEGKVGETVEFADVLMIRGRHKFFLGNPVVENSRVIGKVVRHDRDRKVIVFKKKRRKSFKKKIGHRQSFTQVIIQEIVLPEATVE